MTTSVPEDRVFRYASHYGKSAFVYFLKALVSPMYYRELAYLKREKAYFFKCEACVNDAYESFPL